MVVRRISTIRKDVLILTKLDSGITPKRIVVLLNLQSVYVVYNAVRRRREVSRKANY